MDKEEVVSKNFIEKIIDQDLAEGKYTKIATRFPPEPNGYLHIGHAKSILLNYGLAKKYNGTFNLRFDDTNPMKEKTEFVESIVSDVEWLGAKYDGDIKFASNYFDQMYEAAVLLIKKGKAYVCDLSPEQIREYRGTLTEPGKDSPYRNRSIEENLDLFERMKNGEFEDGSKVLRAKIDMASSNINMRDPIIYRVARMTHHNTGDKWCIYPMYDFAHPLQDAFEGITHSLCSLEFEDHRPLYEWVVNNTEMEHHPRQIEFGRLGITNMIMSKRYLKQLVEEHLVTGYDDPRMPTLVGLKRRGFTPEAIKNFILSTGLSKVNSTTEYGMLEHFLREDLKLKVNRRNAVINPLKVVITNYPEDKIEWLEAENNSENPELGTYKIPFGRNIYIEQEDFLPEKPNKHWKRLSLGLEVRLMHAYFIKCNEIIYNEDGTIKELHCTYDPQTKSGSGFNERKPNGNIHFVEATTAKKAIFNLFEPLILDEKVSAENFKERLNPNSWVKCEGFVEWALEGVNPLDKFQFVRNGYYTVDYESKGNELVFNRIVGLKSSFTV